MSLPSSIVCNPLKRRLKLADADGRCRGQCRGRRLRSRRGRHRRAPVRDPRARLCLRPHRRTDRCAQAHRDRRRLRVSQLRAGCDRRRAWRRRPDRRRRPSRGAADSGRASDRGNARRQSLCCFRVDQAAERPRPQLPQDARRHHARHHVAANRRLDRGGRSIARDHPGQPPRTRERRRHRRVLPPALRRRPRRRVGRPHRPPGDRSSRCAAAAGMPARPC